MSNPVASDSDDENKICRAESRAIRKRKNATKARYSRTTTVTNNSGALSGVPFSGMPRYPFQPPTPAMPAFMPPFPTRPQLFRASPGPSMCPGGCFACGDLSHFHTCVGTAHTTL